MNKEKIIKQIELENGLILKLYDGSRKIAGDRWNLSLIARMDISTSDVLLNDDINPDEVNKALGDFVMFEQKMERNFIDKEVKDEILDSMLDSFTDTSLSYLSHADFSRKFVLKKYKEYIEKRSWYRQ